MKSEKMFGGKLISVYRSDIRLPNGRKGYFEHIKHPGAALIVPFSGDNVIFIRQYRAVIGKYLIELPAGTLNPGETHYACAKREVAEETGYSVKNLKCIGKIFTSPGFCDEIIHIFKAECVSLNAHNRDADEMISLKRVKRKDIPGLLRRGNIVDSKTIAALAFAGLV